jgi:alginate O-acetyltransferase complex protein AlgI
MLFSSFEFVLFFFPITFTGYFLINRLGWLTAAKVWLFSCSLFFYGWWNPAYVPLILASLSFNFLVGSRLNRPGTPENLRKTLLIIGICANVGLLMFYKYMDFFITNANAVAGTDFNVLHLILPLGISFITFQKIAYLVDSYSHSESTRDYSFINFTLFVLFFPQLIAGPIVHHSEIMPDFTNKDNARIHYDNLARGLYLFFMGLCKKIIIADSFGTVANAGNGMTAQLSTADAWITALSYAFQLYYDFSGYSDMAIGAGLTFNVRLPQNFNSPYKSLDIQDFWRRWHITLGRFLTAYIYIPLGGNRKGEARTLLNIMTVFLVSGFWHGAGWTFVFWGLLHGGATVVNRLWKKTNIEMPRWLAWLITFNFVNICWVFFRAKTWADAVNMLKAMLGLANAGTHISVISDYRVLPMMLIGILLLFYKNTNELVTEFSPNRRHLIYLTTLIMIGMIFLNSITASEFLYFDF